MKEFYFLFFLILFQACSTDEPQLMVEDPYFGDPINFAVIGDFGDDGPAESEVAQLVKNWNPEFIITTGDNNYPDGEWTTLKENITKYYEDFIFNPTAPDSLQCKGLAFDLQENQFFPSPGNHDYHPILQLQPYKGYFTLPNNNTYYDFVKGPVHFFSIDSQTAQSEVCCDGIQSTWLKERILASTSPYKVAYFHHAPFSSSQHGYIEYMDWPFEEWGIDVVVAAHNHVYERITPLDKTNFHYLINGLGGRRFIHECNVFELSEQDYDHICFNDDFGAMKAIANGDSLMMQFYSIANPNLLIDQCIIYK